ncbi:MAG: hypothetical protein ACKVP1_12310 [Burkholderiaceae bacterium]
MKSILPALNKVHSVDFEETQFMKRDEIVMDLDGRLSRRDVLRGLATSALLMPLMSPDLALAADGSLSVALPTNPDTA